MDNDSTPEVMVREAMVEGIFYPADRPELISTIQGLLSNSRILPGKARMIVSPHGSFEFSGAIMADAYKTVSASHPQRILVIGPCFHKNSPSIYLPESGLFRTPLDESPVDLAFVNAMLDTSTVIVQNDLPHLQEHSIEVQLPFIQYLFPRVPIVPILLSGSSEIVFRSIISALSIVLRDQIDLTMIVISSNLSTVMDRGQARRESEIILDLVTGGKSAELIAAANRNEISGENVAALAVMAYFARDGEISIVAQGSSLSVHYDPTNVVEYAALALS